MAEKWIEEWIADLEKQGYHWAAGVIRQAAERPRPERPSMDGAKPER